MNFHLHKALPGRKKKSQLYMVADSTTRNIPYYNKGYALRK